VAAVTAGLGQGPRPRFDDKSRLHLGRAVAQDGAVKTET